MEISQEKFIEIIKFLCKEIWDLYSDGDEVDFDKIRAYLVEIGIDPDDIFTF